MWMLFHCIKKTLLITTLVSVFITFVPNLPPIATYLPYGNQLKPQQKLTSDLILNNAERILEGQLVGPEAFTVHKGALYTGLHGGHVVKVLPNKVLPIVKTGKECAGIHQEHLCGRPLGLTVRNDVLYIADAYNGIFSHIFSDGPGNLNHLLGPKVEVSGTPVKIFNCLVVDQNGIIYFTSSSSEFDINEGFHAILSSGTGRLLKFDPKTKKVSSLLDNLLFANGIALSSDEEFLFISETVGRKVLKYHIKSGNVQTILEGLPGLPDNIQYGGDNTFWVSLVTSSDEDYPSLTDVLADWPNIRKFMGRALFLLEFPFTFINEHYPNSFCEKAAYYIGHLGPLLAIFPEKVSIIRFDGNTGKILEALHGNNGIVKGISDIAVVGDHMYLGSPANSFIGRVTLPKNKYAQTEEASKLKSDSGAQAKKAAEEAQAKKAAEAAKKAAEEAKAKKAAEEAKAKKAAEEAKAKKAAEEAKAKKAAEEAKKAAEEVKAKKAAEEAKKAAEEAKAKKAAEEAKKAAEEKAKKATEEAKKAAEEKAKKATEEAKKAAEEKAKAAAEEAKTRKAAEDSKKAAEAAAKAKADKSKEVGGNKISEEEIKTNKISEDGKKSKVAGDKVKTEL